MSSPVLPSPRVPVKPLFSLREINAPAGWTAAVIELEFPASPDVRQAYAAVVAELLVSVAAFERAPATEVLLQVDRCAPDREIPIIQENARSWQPEIGLGVWLDREPPTLWTKEEFLAAAPGTLRPVIDRVFRIQTDLAVQNAAWIRLLGSGTLVRVAASAPGVFLEGATKYLQPRISEPSLSSFPFTLPLLTEAALRGSQTIYPGGPEAWLPKVDGYLRESAEDGGLFMLVRLSQDDFWPLLNERRLGIAPTRLKPQTTEMS